MVVRCLNNTNAHHPRRPTPCQLTLHKEYTVYGIGVRKLEALRFHTSSDITYLIATDDDTPAFCDASRFEVVERSMPSSWTFGYFGITQELFPGESVPRLRESEGAAEGMIGYPELVDNFFHYIGLDLQEEVDIRLFNRRRAEVDAELKTVQG